MSQSCPPIDFVALRHQLEAKDKAFEELQAVNAYLKTEVKRLINERNLADLNNGMGIGSSSFLGGGQTGWQSGLGLGAEACFERQRLEAEATEARVAHRQEMTDVQRKAEQQMENMACRAAKLVTTSVLPSSKSNAPKQAVSDTPSDQNAGQPSAHGPPQGTDAVLHVNSCSSEVQQQVQQLIHSYLLGEVTEDTAVASLCQMHSQLHMRFVIQDTPTAQSPAAPATPPQDASPAASAVKHAARTAAELQPQGPEQKELSAASTQGSGQGSDQKGAQQLSSSDQSKAPLTSAGLRQGLRSIDPSGDLFYSQYVLNEPEKLRRLISRASTFNSTAANAAMSASGLTEGTEAAPNTKPASVSAHPAGPISAANTKESSSSSSGWDWGRSLSSRLLSFGSARFSGTPNTNKEAQQQQQSALPVPSASDSTTDSPTTSTDVSAPASSTANTSTANTSTPTTNKSAPATTHTTSPSSKPLSASAPAFSPASASAAPAGPDVTEHVEQSTAAAQNSTAAAHSNTDAPAAPARSASPNPNNTTHSNGSSKSGQAKEKGAASKGNKQGKGALSVLRKSLEQAEGRQGSSELAEGDISAHTLSAHSIRVSEDDLWQEAAPLGQQGMQLHKV